LPSKTLTNTDTGIDDETDNDEDDSEIDEDDEENLAMIVSAKLDCSRWHRSKKSTHLVVLDLLALLLTTEM
jgi:hypothetical protein